MHTVVNIVEGRKQIKIIFPKLQELLLMYGTLHYLIVKNNSSVSILSIYFDKLFKIFQKFNESIWINRCGMNIWKMSSIRWNGRNNTKWLFKANFPKLWSFSFVTSRLKIMSLFIVHSSILMIKFFSLTSFRNWSR